MRLALIALCTASLSLTACGVDPDAVPPGEDRVAAAQPAPATLDLEASGIIIPPQNGIEQLEIPFGSNRIGTEATLQNIVGEPRESFDSTADCWLSRVEYDGITVSFNDANEFVGYYATTPFIPELTRAEMQADPQVALIEDSTLGEEFLIGDPSGPVISGLFASDADDAPITTLWAGENCIFR